MKILCIKDRNIPISVTNGWKNAFRGFGHEFVYWDSQYQPIFDIFDNFKPDIFISSSEEITRGVVTCIKENVDIKVFLILSEISRENVVDSIKLLKSDIGKPDYIISFNDNANILDIPNLTMMPAADTYTYYPRQYNKLWGSDLAFIGDYGEENSNYILPLCELDYPYSIRIFNREDSDGEDWPVPQYVGKVREENIPNIYSSSSIVIDLSKEIDSFNITACKGFYLTNGDEIDYYMKNEIKRKSIVEYRYKVITTKHTYKQEVEKILNEVGTR